MRTHAVDRAAVRLAPSANCCRRWCWCPWGRRGWLRAAVVAAGVCRCMAVDADVDVDVDVDVLAKGRAMASVGGL